MLDALIGGLAGAGVDALFGGYQAHRNREFQRDMANTQYQRAAKDLEKAGLNRILALGSPAPTTQGAMAPPTRFSEAAIQGASAKQQIEVGKAQADLMRENAALAVAQRDQAEANAAKARAETLSTMELLPLQKEQMSSQADQSRQQAELNRVNALLGGLEQDKQKVLKSLYTVFGPMILDVIRTVRDSFSSATDARTPFPDAVQRVLESMDSSAANSRTQKQADPKLQSEIAQAFEDAVFRGDLPAEKVFELAPGIREKVFERNPGWRKLKLKD